MPLKFEHDIPCSEQDRRPYKNVFVLPSPLSTPRCYSILRLFRFSVRLDGGRFWFDIPRTHLLHFLSILGLYVE
jgi:hypothetical protein